MRYTFTVTIWTNGLFYLLPVSVKALSNYMIVSVHQMLKTKTIKSLFFSLFFFFTIYAEWERCNFWLWHGSLWDTPVNKRLLGDGRVSISRKYGILHWCHIYILWSFQKIQGCYLSVHTLSNCTLFALNIKW